MTKSELLEILEYFERICNDSRVAFESFEKRNNEGDMEKSLYCKGKYDAYIEIIDFLKEGIE